MNSPSDALPAPPRRILVLVDGSEPSLRATRQAASLALQSGGSLCLLHALDDRLVRAFDLLSGARGAIDLGVKPEEAERMLREDASAQLEPAERICRDAGVPCEARVVLRPPLEAALEASSDVELVVLGSRGRGAVSGAVLGSLSQRVIGAVQVPVLVVH